MRNLFYPVFASFLFLASPSQGQTWEVYDFSGSLQTRASYQDITLLGESVSVGKNTSGLFLLSPDLRPVVDLQGQEIFQYLKPWILVKGPKGIGAFHEYGQLALPLEYEEISTYTNRLLARKGKDYWVFEKSTGKTKWLGTAEEAMLTRNGQVILKNQACSEKSAGCHEQDSPGSRHSLFLYKRRQFYPQGSGDAAQQV